MIFKEKMVIILTRGKHAAKKAIVHQINGDYLLTSVVIVKKPKKHDLKKKLTLTKEKHGPKSSLKKVKITHAIATRYNVDYDFKGAIGNYEFGKPSAERTKINDSITEVLANNFEKDSGKFVFRSFSY